MPLEISGRTGWKKDILEMLPTGVARAIGGLSRENEATLEEIRLRAKMPLCILARGRNLMLREDGNEARDPSAAYIVGREECEEFLNRISQYSVYALEEEMRRGFLTIRGGYRVGICGKAVVEGGRLRTISPCTFFNLRIAREVVGAANHIMRFILSEGRVLSTLLMSPPGMGKTTMLRDAVRQLAQAGGGSGGCKVAVVDERSEIAGARRGIMQNDLGMFCDVLDGCPKAEGMMLVLRAMSPEVVATDEIGRTEDIEAIREAMLCGVKVIATMHAGGFEEARRRLKIRQADTETPFERYILLSRRYGPGSLEMVWDADGMPILERAVRPYGGI